MTDNRTLWLLITLSAATFFITATSSGTAPFLRAIAQDLSTGLPAIAQLFGMQAVTWGIASLVVGSISDRVGRRVILVTTLALLGLTRIGFAWSTSYAGAAFWQILSGLAGGGFMGTVFATVADRVPAPMRGRALSWVITGQSLALVIGVPIVTWLASFAGWRGAVSSHGVATIISAVSVWLVTPTHPPPAPHTPNRVSAWSALSRPSLVSLLIAGSSERLCFAMLAIYLPTYLQLSYDVGFKTLGGALALVALGNVAGNLLGGRLADAFPARAITFAVSSVFTAALAVPTLGWQPGIGGTLALGFAMSLVNAAGRPCILATLSEVPDHLRGTVFGLNVAMASVGWLSASAAGAFLLSGDDSFSRMGWVCAMVAGGGAVFALVSGMLSRREPRFDRDGQRDAQSSPLNRS